MLKPRPVKSNNFIPELNPKQFIINTFTALFVLFTLPYYLSFTCCFVCLLLVFFFVYAFMLLCMTKYFAEPMKCFD